MFIFLLATVIEGLKGTFICLKVGGSTINNLTRFSSRPCLKCVVTFFFGRATQSEQYYRRIAVLWAVGLPFLF